MPVGGELGLELLFDTAEEAGVTHIPFCSIFGDEQVLAIVEVLLPAPVHPTAGQNPG